MQVCTDTVVTHSSQGRATFPGVSRVSVVGGIDEDVEDVAGEPGATVTVLGLQTQRSCHHQHRLDRGRLQ